ncbi:hypothetical protein [Oceanicoccus sp. KOV_DT_Chl]|uniref:hypothetical protein n=1 Tax=Oceanicoccus sp. KOV_DT_Chl TaxID=1904639 RepID=UPI000C7E5DDD|nr:hypothetical protein [Oceanicoccus sp. KOV_DT_Chl]
MTKSTKPSIFIALIIKLLLVTPLSNAAPINLVDYFSLSGTGLIDFQDIPTPGGSVNFDSPLAVSGASFSERFTGQALSYSGASDVLSGSPLEPLSLQSGAIGENIRVAEEGSNKGIDGHSIGSFGGEGALALLFDQDQLEFGLAILGVMEAQQTSNFGLVMAHSLIRSHYQVLA